MTSDSGKAAANKGIRSLQIQRQNVNNQKKSQLNVRLSDHSRTQLSQLKEWATELHHLQNGQEEWCCVGEYGSDSTLAGHILSEFISELHFSTAVFIERQSIREDLRKFGLDILPKLLKLSKKRGVWPEEHYGNGPLDNDRWATICLDYELDLYKKIQKMEELSKLDEDDPLKAELEILRSDNKLFKNRLETIQKIIAGHSFQEIKNNE